MKLFFKIFAITVLAVGINGNWVSNCKERDALFHPLIENLYTVCKTSDIQALVTAGQRSVTVTPNLNQGQFCVSTNTAAAVKCAMELLTITTASGSVTTNIDRFANTISVICDSQGYWTLGGSQIVDITCAPCPVCEVSDLQRFDNDLSVTAPLGPESCIVSGSVAAIECPLYWLAITTLGGTTSRTCGVVSDPNTINVECTTAGWALGGELITGIACEPPECRPGCATTNAVSQGTGVDILVSTCATCPTGLAAEGAVLTASCSDATETVQSTQDSIDTLLNSIELFCGPMGWMYAGEEGTFIVDGGAGNKLICN